ncbi:uncharacterized protein LOC134769822 isoform X2 [Penaeus indicus]|uniref:uncharacterized protein LOC134769822 isoform X2 n=1 Tax=Penaeus indicus TaxID=29960 RepID=UPI00300C4B11
MPCQVLSLVLLTLHLLYGSVGSLGFATSCVPSSSLDTDGIGTKWEVISWAPKNGGAVVLSLISKNDKNSSLRKIDITRTEVHTLFIQGGHRETKTSSIPDAGLPPGWREFRVTSDSRFKVWVMGVEEPLVDVEDDVRAERVVVRGSNVTINCREPFFIWNVSEDRETTLPLGGPGRYDLAVFSRSPLSPVVKLGNRTLVLSWDPEFSMVTTLALESRPLPAFVQHNFTLNCSYAQNHFQYNILAGQNDTVVGSVSLPEEVDWMSFRARSGEPFVVTSLKAQQEQEAAMPDPGTCLKNSATFIPIYVNGVLAVICAFLAVKVWRLKMEMKSMIETKPPLYQSGDSAQTPFPPALPQETAPLNNPRAFPTGS